MREPLVVLQTRTSSSRLPGKALLPVAGLPSAVLAARRAARGGLRVRVATSDDRSDDILARTLQQAGIDVVRGPLDDVLARFALATADLPDDGRVIRLTADNLLPDDDFLRELVAAHDKFGGAYLGTHSPLDGLPYGLSAELFNVNALRAAAASATEAADREHVTPWIRRQATPRLHAPEGIPAHWSRLRCTIDTFNDYLAVAAAFDSVSDPVSAPVDVLLERLANASPGGAQPRCPWRVAADGQSHSVLTLGSAQFGLDYGVANVQGRPDDAALDAVLTCAVDAGIGAVDTARAYGDAELRLGAWLGPRHESRLKVTTKLGVLHDLPEDAPAGWVHAAVDASILRSLQALRMKRLDTLLLHRWSHRHAWQGAVWQRLLQLRAEGLIGALGASISSVDEAVEAMGDPDVVHLQAPVNLLDQRWRSRRWLTTVAARPSVVVHARSVLLQGLITLAPDRWPHAPGVVAKQIGAHLDGLVAALGRRDRVDLALAYVRGLPWVTSLVVGIDGAAQLAENLARVQTPALTPAEIDQVTATLPDLPKELLDPSRWSFTHD